MQVNANAISRKYGFPMNSKILRSKANKEPIPTTEKEATNIAYEANSHLTCQATPFLFSIHKNSKACSSCACFFASTACDYYAT